MITYKGAYENGMFKVCCQTCGTEMKKWEKMATESIERGGQRYVFRCPKCKKRIEVINTKG